MEIVYYDAKRLRRNAGDEDVAFPFLWFSSLFLNSKIRRTSVSTDPFCEASFVHFVSHLSILLVVYPFCQELIHFGRQYFVLFRIRQSRNDSTTSPVFCPVPINSLGVKRQSWVWKSHPL